MNLNILGYAIYLSLTVFIIIRVGRICYRNGNVFVSELIPHHEDLCHRINQVLLLAYYLLNIGYCAITIIQWDQIGSVQLLVETIAFKAATIICIIAALHYCNIIVITKYVQKLIQ